MEDAHLTSILLEWSTTFIRLSLHDFNRSAHSAGLSLVQMTALMHLYYQGPSEVTHFCKSMRITPAGASQMIERMVRQGVVHRSETPGDRRVRLVSLTDLGRQVAQQSINARQVWLEQMVAGLSAEESEQVAAALQLLNEQANKLVIHPT